MREHLARLAAIAALVTTTLPARADAASSHAGRMVVAAPGHVGSLDPRRGSSTVAREVWKLQYPLLVSRTSSDLDPAPGVATGWVPAPDGNGWVYTLASGLAWSDGRPLTADDVVFSLTQARDGKWPYAGERLDDLDAHASDSRTVVVTTSRPNPVLPLLPVHVVPRHVFERVPNLDADLAGLGVGAGRWHVVAHDRDEVTMRAVPQPLPPPIGEIVFRTIARAGALYDAFAHGDADVVSDLPARDAGRVLDLDGVTVVHANDGEQYVLRVHTTNGEPALRDPGLRRAIGFAVDRTNLVTDALGGVGRASVVPIAARGTRWQLPVEERRGFDAALDAEPDEARDLVRRAPTPSRALRIGYAPADREARRLATGIARSLRSVGLPATTVDAASGSDLGVVLQPATDDPTPALASLTCRAGVWCDAEYDELFARYSTTTDLAARVDAARAMLRRAIEQQVEIGLVLPDRLQAVRYTRIAALVRRPDAAELLVFGPAADRYGDATIAPAPPGDDPGYTPLVIGAAVVVGACAGVYAFAARLRVRQRLT